LRRLEGHRGLLAALRAYGRSFNSKQAWVSGGCDPEGGYAFSLAGFAPLGFVPEILIVKERLLTGGEYEIGVAVNAL
jgi:hypothetical protein